MESTVDSYEKRNTIYIAMYNTQLICMCTSIIHMLTPIVKFIFKELLVSMD